MALLVGLPLLCWLLVYATQGRDGISSEPMWFLFAGFMLWTQIPDMLFGGTLFDSGEGGHHSHDVVGFVVVIAFYVGISLIISFSARQFVARRRRRPI
jgi:hypothetical protein